MAVVGINAKPKSNKLSPSLGAEIGLPLPFSKGSISLSLNFESQPSGQINIEGVSQTEIQKYRATYGVIGTKLTLFKNLEKPVYLEISSYGETEDVISIDSSFSISVFNISVGLKGGHEKRMSRSFQNSARAKYSFSGRSGSIGLSTLASLAGIPYLGYNYAIEVPPNSPDFSVSFGGAASQNLRLKRQIAHYEGPTVKTVGYREGKRWDILKSDIIYEIQISKQEPLEYEDTKLSGKSGDSFVSNAEKTPRNLDELLKQGQTRKTPTRLILEEGDERPTEPPRDVSELNSIDLNADMSGPRKTLKVTTLLNNQPFKEELFTYGFAYLAENIRNPNADLETSDREVKALTGDPAQWWTLIEYQTTEYIYEPSRVNISLVAKDKVTGKTFPIKYTGSQAFDNRYLTSIITKGWKLGRFQQEQFDEQGTDFNTLDSRWLTEEIADLESPGGAPEESDQIDLQFFKEQLNSISFRKIPFQSVTQYHLAPVNHYYTTEPAIPFQTQLVEKEELGMTGKGKILVATPDKTYVFPMLVLNEKTLTQSFDQIDHPQNIYIRQDRQDVLTDGSLSKEEKEDELRQLKLLPWLTTGEDTYSETDRKIIPSKNTTSRVGYNPKKLTDLFTEYSTSASNHDINFVYSLQEKKFRISTGRPTDATVFTYEYEDSVDKSKEDKDLTDPLNYEYVLNTTSKRFANSVDSIQFDTDSLGLAISAARCDLAINNFMNTDDYNLNLAWYYPSIRPGDYLSVMDDLSKPLLRVKSTSFTINFQGYVGNELIVTCDGTNITCGVFNDKPVGASKKRKDAVNDDTSGENLDIQTRISGADMFGTSLYPKMRTRRNPAGRPIPLI